MEDSAAFAVPLILILSELQLIKAAMAAGVEKLMDDLGIKTKDIDWSVPK